MIPLPIFAVFIIALIIIVALYRAEFLRAENENILLWSKLREIHAQQNTTTKGHTSPLGTSAGAVTSSSYIEQYGRPEHRCVCGHQELSHEISPNPTDLEPCSLCGCKTFTQGLQV